MRAALALVVLLAACGGPRADGAPVLRVDPDGVFVSEDPVAGEWYAGEGVTLLLPGLVLLVGSAQLLPRGVRCWRRRGLEGLPIRSLNRRLIPWTATAMVAPLRMTTKSDMQAYHVDEP